MILHSEEFVKKWKNLLKTVYGYEERNQFLLVPSLSLKKDAVYLPLLNYSDKKALDELDIRGIKDYQLRVLNEKYQDFKERDTVTMRLDIDGKDYETIFTKQVKSRARNKIRNSHKKNNFTFKFGHEKILVEEFYEIFANTMYKHGTPVLDKKLFIKISEDLKNESMFFLIYDREKPIGGMCVLFDKAIAWMPWVGIDENYSRSLAGYYLYDMVLKYIVEQGSFKIFDFGRSDYGGNTYSFKSQWGAKPVKIDIISNKNYDVYSKYQLASTIWKKLPKNLVDYIGPKLCKYLKDL